MSGAMQALIVAAAALGGLAVYLMMPRGAVANHRTGMAFGAGSLALLWIIWILSFRDVGVGRAFLFCMLGSITVIGGVMTVTRTNPVSCALSFAAVVIGTAGLFLLANAQFLAAAIVIVYAGAIIVMFLFVVMMAQQHGTALYDRLSREPALAVIAGFVLLIALISAGVATYGGESPALMPIAGRADVSEASFLDTVPDAPQVATLGRALLIDHWLSLEVAGAMLLVAMVGAILISARSVKKGGGHLMPQRPNGSVATPTRDTSVRSRA
jgi:NADH-quinone oxidoreductase subunit J